MAEIVLSNVLGLVLGIIASFISWWILFHGLTPNVQFADFIRKVATTDQPCGWKYQFQFGNRGRRPLVDVQVSARLSVERTDDPGILNNISLRLSWEGDKKVEVPRIPPKNYRAFRLFIDHIREIEIPALFSDEIRAKATNGTLLLEDLLTPSNRAFLKVYVAGYDELSGARRVFESKPYRVDGIADTFSAEAQGLQSIKGTTNAA